MKTPETEPPHEPTVDELQAALGLVHARVLAEARLRGWCSEYEDVVTRINEQLGFEALGKRMRRQTVSCSIELRVRGPYRACDEAYGRFQAYVNAYVDPALVEVKTTVRYGETNDIEEDHINPPNPPGYDPMSSCNCEDCMNERVERERTEQRLADTQPVPAQPRIRPGRAVDPRAIPRPTVYPPDLV